MDGAEDSEDKIEVVPATEGDAIQADEESKEDENKLEGENSLVTEEQWQAIRSILEYLLAYREEDGHDPSKVFHKRVNRRNVPSYYDVIKEPMAFSNLKASLANHEYKDFKEFVRECALIWHNAHTYNRPDAGAYQDASTMKRLMEQEFQKLVEKNTITPEEAEWPELGEIPPVEDLPPEEDEEEDDEEDEDEEDEVEESDEDGQKKKRRGRRLSAAAARGAGEGTKRRGRPPKVDTPMEARIKSILKGLRRVKDSDGNPRILQFEKLPDKQTMPEYYQEIKRPISIETLKKSLKRKRYSSVDHFMIEVELMFENAKHFNEDDSQIFEDAVELQKEAQKLAQFEKDRPDSDFVTDEGRKPRPGGIEYNGERWKVGDWIHIRNANDISKPIVAQIYRTWEDADGQEWMNACWYYRPEQTVHHFEKHFWPNEVLKTGQYRDHRIEELIDRCFVMFYTRYTKGRPKGVGSEREVYVCEARYNEEKHRINKIKTWASCLPDEVRDQDYEMDLFDSYTTRKVKKIPSPLVGTLNEDTKDSSNLPQPRWGADNAPPIVGGIYKGPRDDNQSPPPEPTPEPTPQPPSSLPRQASHRPSQDVMNHSNRSGSNPPLGNFSRPSVPTANSQPSASTVHVQSSQGQSGSPGSKQIQQGQQASSTLNYPAVTPAPSQSPSYSQYGQTRYPQQGTGQYATSQPPIPSGQRMPDVFYLQAANAAIPEDIRKEFQRDEQGHVLFFSKPPISIQRSHQDLPALHSSAKARAARIRQRLEDEKTGEVESEPEAQARPAKRSKLEVETNAQQADFGKTIEHWRDWLNQHQKGTNEIWKLNYGDSWQDVKKIDMDRLKGRQAEAKTLKKMLDAKAPSHEKLLQETRKMLQPLDVYKDDINPRY